MKIEITLGRDFAGYWEARAPIFGPRCLAYSLYQDAALKDIISTVMTELALNIDAGRIDVKDVMNIEITHTMRPDEP